jgi:hypothetical protein
MFEPKTSRAQGMSSKCCPINGTLQASGLRGRDFRNESSDSEYFWLCCHPGAIRQVRSPSPNHVPQADLSGEIPYRPQFWILSGLPTISLRTV